MTAPPTTLARLQAIVGETLERAPESVSAETGLRELGATSLDVLEIATCIEERFGVIVNEHELADVATIGDLAVFVERAMVRGQA